MDCTARKRETIPRYEKTCRWRLKGRDWEAEEVGRDRRRRAAGCDPVTREGRCGTPTPATGSSHGV